MVTNRRKPLRRAYLAAYLLALVCLSACTGSKPPSPTLTPPAGLAQPTARGAGSQTLTPQELGAQPGGLDTVRMAYTLLLDKYYKPLKSDDLLHTAWSGVMDEAGKSANHTAADAPKLTGQRDADFAAFSSSFDAATGQGDKAKYAFAAVDAMARSLNDDHTAFLDANLYKQFGSANSATNGRQVFTSRMLPNGIGYMKLSSFPAAYEKLGGGKILADELDDALNNFESQGVKGWVLDLRNNGGGHTESVATISGRFIPSGLQETDVDAKGDRLEVPFDGHYFPHHHPLAVLTNGRSGSASEITAAALKDYGAARVFGSRTAGAVNGAEIFPLPGQVGLEYTVVQVLAGKTGAPLDGVGVTPDEVVTDQSGSDPALDAADAWILGPGASAPAATGSPRTSPDTLKPAQIRDALGRYGAQLGDIPPLPNLRLLGDATLDTPDQFVLWAPCTTHAAQLAQTAISRGWQGQFDQFFGSGDPFTYEIAIDAYKDQGGAQQAFHSNECPEGFQAASVPLRVGDESVAMKGTGVLLGWTLLRWRHGRAVFSAYFYSEPGLQSFDPLAQMAKAIDQRYDASPLK
jgi:hypothetical protein